MLEMWFNSWNLHFSCCLNESCGPLLWLGQENLLIPHMRGPLQHLEILTLAAASLSFIPCRSLKSSIYLAGPASHSLQLESVAAPSHMLRVSVVQLDSALLVVAVLHAVLHGADSYNRWLVEKQIKLNPLIPPFILRPKTGIQRNHLICIQARDVLVCNIFITMNWRWKD